MNRLTLSALFPRVPSSSFPFPLEIPQSSVELVFFPVDDNVTFSVVGDSNVDLTGIIIAALEEDDEEEEGEENEEEENEEESEEKENEENEEEEEEEEEESEEEEPKVEEKKPAKKSGKDSL